MQGKPARTLTPDLLANARVLPNRCDILPLLPKNKVFAEVGVGLGTFSEAIIATCMPSRFIAIDNFVLHTIPLVWGRKTTDVFGNLTHEEYYRQKLRAHIDSGSVQVSSGDSVAMLKQLPDRSVDIFYVDANHTYEAVSNELALIKFKIRDSGYIILNDYIFYDHLSQAPYGVIQATNEFMLRERWEMVYFALAPEMFCDVVLRKF
jgi:hypothetical protein